MEKYPYTEENIIVRPYGSIFMAYRRVFKRRYWFFGEYLPTERFETLYWNKRQVLGNNIDTVTNKINRIIEENRKFVQSV